MGVSLHTFKDGQQIFHHIESDQSVSNVLRVSFMRGKFAQFCPGLLIKPSCVLSFSAMALP